LQRLPPQRIQRAHELSEIDLEEDPAPSGLGTGNEAALGARTNLFRMHVKEGCGFIEIECPYRSRLRAELCGMDAIGDHRRAIRCSEHALRGRRAPQR
jgi:hypothetical protein